MVRPYLCDGVTANEMYDILNRRYFRGRLPKIPVRWNFGKECPKARQKRTLGYTAFGPKKRNGEYTPYFIVLSPRIKMMEVIWVSTLLHEMVHVEQRYLPRAQAHGQKFNRRMKQLAQRGAFKGLW